MDIQTIVAILSFIVSVIGVVATVLSMFFNVKNKIEVESNKFKSVFLNICIIVVLAIIAIGAIVYLLSNSNKLLGDSSDENEMSSNSFDSFLNSENVSMDGVSSSISDYSSRDNEISKDEEKSDSDDLDSYTSINDEIETNSLPTSSTSISTIEPIHDVTYNRSANIVNGGFCCYDDGQYYFGGSELKKSSFPYTNDQTIIYNGSTYYLNPVGDYLYFTTTNENNSICRVKKDGTNFEVLYNNPCHELTFYEGWLYFCSNMGDENYHICRMNPENLEVKILYDCREWYMSIYNDKIFFCNCDDNYNIYSMNLDGSDCKPIYYGECYDLCIVNNKIYFSKGAQSRQLYRIDLDGSDLILLRDSYTIYTNYRDDKLYYIDSDGLLCKCNLDGTHAEIVQNLSSYSFVILLPDKIICSYDRNLEKNIIILET